MAQDSSAQAASARRRASSAPRPDTPPGSHSQSRTMALAQAMDEQTLPMMYKPSVQVEMPDKRVQLQGLDSTGPTARAGAQPRHPVERFLVDHVRREEHQEMMGKALVFGQHAPVRAKLEREMLSQFQRLPGLPSSLVGLETVLDMDESIEFEDIFNLEENAPMPKLTSANRGLHDVMEQRLNMRF
uniref:Proteasome maturation protein n=1 Tax=Alexandrium catenella TaxID=2925 RepID=A0A7S1Q8L4_ALECA